MNIVLQHHNQSNQCFERDVHSFMFGMEFLRHCWHGGFQRERQ